MHNTSDHIEEIEVKDDLSADVLCTAQQQAKYCVNTLLYISRVCIKYTTLFRCNARTVCMAVVMFLVLPAS